MNLTDILETTEVQLATDYNRKRDTSPQQLA